MTESRVFWYWTQDCRGFEVTKVMSKGALIPVCYVHREEAEREAAEDARFLASVEVGKAAPNPMQ